jgi:hypothetical protein
VGFPVELGRDYGDGGKVALAVSGSPPGTGDIYWDGDVLAEDVKTTRGWQPIELPADLDLSAGEHELTVEMTSGRVFRLDAMRFEEAE